MRLKRFSVVFSIVAAISFAASLDAEPLAFPHAEGYGRFASGGRGGTVYEVTHLGDSGPGSLREAVEAKGPRTVVFRVSGTIYLESDLKVNNGDLTIAGQSAPGDGICIAKRGLQVNADNVVIRFIRVRLGDLYPRENGLQSFESDAFECRYTDNVIIDHCTFSWSIDECATAYNNTNFTMQWCMVTESLRNSFHSKGAHGYGGIWGGTNVTFHHNLLAHHTSRNPRFNGARYDDPATWDRQVDHRDNVVYNWGGNSCYGGEPNASGFQANYNIVNNYYKSGPATSGSKRDRIIEVTPLDGKVSRFFVGGNYVWGEKAAIEDNWLGVDNIPSGQEAAARAGKPFLMAPLTSQDAHAAFDAVLNWGGASFPSRDSVDTRIVEEVRSGATTYGDNGIIDSQEEVGGYPVLSSDEAPLDTDGDGMPDEWELAHDLDPADSSDRNTVDTKTGYTALEIYLNGLVSHLYPNPRVEMRRTEAALVIDWENLLNDASLFSSSDAEAWIFEQDSGTQGQVAVPLEAVQTLRFYRFGPKQE
jgi:hypothetical protein